MSLDFFRNLKEHIYDIWYDFDNRYPNNIIFFYEIIIELFLE